MQDLLDPLYTAWRAMRARCNRATHAQYADYGGRGITVCPRWRSFVSFENDMGPHPGKGWSLDRIDNDGHYEPLNCRWASSKQQNRNRRFPLRAADVAEIRSLYLGDCRVARGGVTRQDLATRYGVHRITIRNIVRGVTWV